MKKAPIALLFALAALAILSLASTAQAVTIHKHMVVHRVVGHDPDGPVKVAQEVVRVETVPPSDSDQDGYADSEDNCPHEPYSSNGGCEPAPVPVANPVSESVAPAPEPTTPIVPTTSATTGGCPASMAPESGSAGYSAYNPSSGATGCYQILGSTAAAYGCDLSTPAGQDACAQSICADVGNSAWAASGATPCG